MRADCNCERAGQTGPGCSADASVDVSFDIESAPWKTSGLEKTIVGFRFNGNKLQTTAGAQARAVRAAVCARRRAATSSARKARPPCQGRFSMQPSQRIYAYMMSQSTYRYRYIYIYIYIVHNIYIHAHLYVIYVCIYMHTYIYIYIMYSVHIRIYIYIYICIYIYIERERERDGQTYS